jgi:hypothetical protein
LEKVLSSAALRQALQATGRVNGRACPLTPEVLLWLVRAMGVLTHMPIRQGFKHARRMHAGEAQTPGRSRRCEARQRLGVEPVRYRPEHPGRPLATPDTPGAFFPGLRLMGLEGTVFDGLDRPAHAAAFQRATGRRGPGAVPQARKVSWVELGPHGEGALALGGWQDSEPALARQLGDRIPPGTLLLEDRGFFSYDDWKRLDARGGKLFIRVQSNLILAPIQPRSDGSDLAKIYPTSYDREKDRKGIGVRVLAYQLDDPQRGGHGQEHRFITHRRDEQAFPARERMLEYPERWEEELVFDEQKPHQDPRRAEKPAQVRRETPAGVQPEVYAWSVAHFGVRALMVAAARPLQREVDRRSFRGCLPILRARLPEGDSRTPAPLEQWYANLLAELQQERTDPRRNRINPRVINRKRKKWEKKGPHHRPVPPLKKRFIETVVMIT